MSNSERKAVSKQTKSSTAAAALQNLLRASREEYDDDAVQELVKRDPGARICDFPIPLLHQALRCRASVDTIRLLCDAAHPGAIREKDSDLGGTALHEACRYGATVDVVRLLYERWPEAVAMKDSLGHMPLHTACVTSNTRSSLEVAKFIVGKCPESLAVKDEDGETPLHLACFGVPMPYFELVAFLIEKNADAAKEKSNSDHLPLHWACYWRASLKTVTLLLDQYPAALEGRTYFEETPLHLACRRGAPRDVIQMLVERCPKALVMKNDDGYTPLHGACDGYNPVDELCEEEIIQLLVERCPETVAMQDKKERTPLQCAIKSETSSPEVIKLLTALQALNNLRANDPQIMDTLKSFRGMNWPGGVALVLNAFPSAANKLGQNLMPTVLSLVGRRCTLNSFYLMLQDNPALVKGAVKKGKRSKKPPAKKARRQ